MPRFVVVIELEVQRLVLFKKIVLVAKGIVKLGASLEALGLLAGIHNEVLKGCDFGRAHVLLIAYVHLNAKIF